MSQSDTTDRCGTDSGGDRLLDVGGSLRDGVRRLSADQRTLLSIGVVTLFALFVRLYDLGERVFHWDEGRVGYWTLRYAETGQFEYAPIIHGPFLRIVNATVFSVLPPTDASARLVVALVGGLLPLSVWLFREHLDRVELVLLASLLAFNPLLVYYSRFMRNDVLVGAFAFVALGFAVRAIDSRDVRYLYPGAVFLALSVTTKANTLLYVLCFVGAGVLVADHGLVRRIRDRNTDRSAEDRNADRSAESSSHNGWALRTVLINWARTRWRGLHTVAGARHPIVFLGGHLFGVAAAFLVVVVFFYAPRPLLYHAIGSPGLWPAVVHEATVGSARELADLWITGDMQDNPYLRFLRHELETLVHAATVTVSFALVGFVVDGYVRGRDGVPAGRNRAFVAFAVYWGTASLLGYPAATDINAPWSAVHVVFPLTIPAAVGLAYVVREAWAARAAGDRRTVVLVALLLLAVTAGIAAPTATHWNAADPDRTAVVQWAQPHNDLRPTLESMEAIAEHNDGTDVLFVGSDTASRENSLYVANESAADRKGAPGGWYDRLPLPWYYERAGANVESVSVDADRAAALESAPPIVIAHADAREEIEPHLDGYRATEHDLRLWGYRLVFFIEEDALETATN